MDRSSAMVIDYGFCTGCKSCEISCRNEKDLPLDQWGIRIQELGPQKLEGEWEWDYLPALSHVCDLCADRRAAGQKAACELHCLADVIRIVPVDEAMQAMLSNNRGKQVCYIPN